MQYLLQPKRAESILQTTEAFERWECDVREYEHKFGKTLDGDVKIGVILLPQPFWLKSHFLFERARCFSLARALLVLSCPRVYNPVLLFPTCSHDTYE